MGPPDVNGTISRGGYGWVELLAEHSTVIFPVLILGHEAKMPTQANPIVHIQFLS